MKMQAGPVVETETAGLRAVNFCLQSLLNGVHSKFRGVVTTRFEAIHQPPNFLLRHRQQKNLSSGYSTLHQVFCDRESNISSSQKYYFALR